MKYGTVVSTAFRKEQMKTSSWDLGPKYLGEGGQQSRKIFKSCPCELEGNQASAQKTKRKKEKRTKKLPNEKQATG